MKRKFLILLTFAVLGMGCGGRVDEPCRLTAIRVFPETATVDHSALPPGNSQQFLAFESGSSPGCVHTLASLTNAVWAISDPVNASINNDPKDVNYGRATCMNPTSNPIIVTATVTPATGS